MPKEVCLLGAFAPKLDGERQSVDRLLVAADERSAKIDSFQVVLLGLQLSDLPNVVTATTLASSGLRAMMILFYLMA